MHLKTSVLTLKGVVEMVFFIDFILSNKIIYLIFLVNFCVNFGLIPLNKFLKIEYTMLSTTKLGNQRQSVILTTR